jgi:hypothetical protein
VTVRTKGDEIIILVCLALSPWDNVVDVNFDVSARGNGASMAGFNINAPTEVSGNWWSVFH